MQATRPGGPWMRGNVRETASFQATWPLHPSAVRLGRQLVRTACHRVREPDACDTAAITVSELVGNAVKAGAGSAVTLRLTWTPRRLRVEVIDACPRAPERREAEPMDEGGRGLWLVSEFAARWGVEPAGGGKRVWAEIALPGQAG